MVARFVESHVRLGINRTGLGYSVAALLAAIGTAVAISSSASESKLFVNQLVGLGVLVFTALMVFGSARWLAASSLPILITVVLESGFGDNPSWVRSLVIGCLWFVTMELGWEAIDRRDEATRTPAANARRLQEVATVVAVSLVLGFVATGATAFAPVRSVLLQAVMIGGLLVALVLVVRHLTAKPSSTTAP